MKNVESSYWISIGLVTTILAVAIWIVFGFIIPEMYPRILPFFLAVVVVLTATGQVLLTRAVRKDPKKFNSWYLIYKSIKMLIIMTFMLVYILVNRKNGISFLASVFVIYLTYMIFEAGALNRAARKESGN